MDTITKEARSRNMSAIRSRDTSPEMRVRRMLHSFGYRYRTHLRLPGRPDIVFSRKRKVIFIHGCFWHAHQCASVRFPKSNEGYWTPKLKMNVERDHRNMALLRASGWDVLVLWACQLDNEFGVAASLKHFLGLPKTS